MGRRAGIVTYCRYKMVILRLIGFDDGRFFRIFKTDIYVPTGAAAFFFNFCEIGPFVPVGFRVVVEGDRIEAWSIGDTAGDDSVGHADNG